MAAPPLALVALLVPFYILVVLLAALYLGVRRPPRPRQLNLPPPERESALELPAPAGEEEHAGEGGSQKQRRRRRRRKREKQEGEQGGDAAAPSATAAAAGEALLPQRPQFPLALVAGALQRRINARYDELARASEARCLTIEQVNEFINCLVDARNELLQRYENVQRSFKIKKAMLSNPRSYRSSYDRLFEQVRRLETELRNLKADADIYNHIQEGLRKSASYKLIAKISDMEAEASEISFEELLAQEKEDTAFWQRHGKLGSSSSK